MDLDAYRRLPIPEWLDLACPQCGYALRGLPEHRCRECGLRFDIDDLITPATPLRPPEITPETRPVPDLGLTCENCDYPLRGLPGDRCPECGEAFDLYHYVPAEPWVEIAPWADTTEKQLIKIHLRSAGIPCAMSDASDVLQTLYGGRASVLGGPALRVRHDYYLDALATLRASREEIAPEWTCPRCGETSPGNFEVCWKCQGAREQSAAGSE